MKKKILTLALICICAVLGGAVCACSQGETNQIEYTLSTDGTYYTVTGAENVKGDVVIEATYNGLPVREIGGNAFYDCNKMTSVTIPDSVTTIGEYSFRGCSSLTSIEIPESVTDINQYAFVGCSSLVSINIPESVTVINNGAFRGCSSLSEIIIPDSVTYIGSSAFSSCSSLVEITIPDSVTYLGFGAFEDSTSLERVTLSDNLESLGIDVFRGCDNLQYNVYNNAKYIGSSQNDYFLLYAPANTDITSCATHENTKIINSYAFSGCTSLREVTINGAAQTGYYAFNGCTTLEKVTLGESITEISTASFRNCCALTTINLPESVTAICEIAFYNCSSLINLTLPESLTSIGSQAFCSCSSLENLKIPDSVICIGSDAFDGCVNLWEIIDGVYLIDGWVMFSDGTKTEITIPDGARGIADEAFTSYVSMGASVHSTSILTYIYIPASVKYIGTGAFESCPLETAIFEDPDGWSVYNNYSDEVTEISAEELADPATAAALLASSRDESLYWYKEG